MPIYEYQCRSCGHELEKLQRINDQMLTNCPDCGEAELRRLVSAAGFRLKGAGWYETDFKKDGKKNLHDSGDGTGEKKQDKPSPADSKKPAESKKTESTPAKSTSGAA